MITEDVIHLAVVDATMTTITVTEEAAVAAEAAVVTEVVRVVLGDVGPGLGLAPEITVMDVTEDLAPALVITVVTVTTRTSEVATADTVTMNVAMVPGLYN